MANKSLVLIKPEGFAFRGQILERLQHEGRISYQKFYETTPLDILRNHYKEHEGTEIYPWLISYYADKPLEVLIMEGENIVPRIKSLVGPSDPRKANPGTLRSLSTDSLEDANREKRPIKNLVHCSSDDISAIREVELWTL